MNAISVLILCMWLLAAIHLPSLNTEYYYKADPQHTVTCGSTQHSNTFCNITVHTERGQVSSCITLLHIKNIKIWDFKSLNSWKLVVLVLWDTVSHSFVDGYQGISLIHFKWGLTAHAALIWTMAPHDQWPSLFFKALAPTYHTTASHPWNIVSVNVKIALNTYWETVNHHMMKL
jgi:hypothetical protein